MSWPVTVNGRTYTEADFAGNAYVEGLPSLAADLAAHAANGWSASSATSMAIGVGSRTLLVQAAKPFGPGQPLRLAVTADPAKYMDGYCVSYDQATGSLTVMVGVAVGAGTYAAWTVTIGGARVAGSTSPLAITEGGTGATTAAGALATLGGLLAAGGAASNLTLTGSTSLPGGGQITSGGHIYLGGDAGSPELRLRGGTGAGIGPMIRLQRAGADIGYIGSLAGVVGGNSDDMLLHAAAAKGVAVYTGGGSAGYVAPDRTWHLGGAPGAETLRVVPSGSGDYVSVSAASGAVDLWAAGSSASVAMRYVARGTAGHGFYTGTYGSGVEQLRIGHASGATDRWEFNGSAGGSAIQAWAQGASAAVPIHLISKGSAPIYLSTGSAANNQVAVGHVANAVNCLQISGGAAGNPAQIYAVGADPNIGVRINTKGTGAFALTGSGGGHYSFVVNAAPSTVNYITMSTAPTGSKVSIGASGADSDIGLYVQGKGAGGLVLGQSAGAIGFFGSGGATKPSITGSRGGNAALTSLLTQLAGLGLVTDSTAA